MTYAETAQLYADAGWPVPKPVLFTGDCLDVMRLLPDNSVAAIVTDPPYGLGFMGKAWDDLPPGLPWAQECLRVLKPGGHLIAFGGTRTWHRLACTVEDAGFEMRDSIAWLYGSGFPKSLDVSKAIDKAAGAEREVIGRTKTPFKVDAAATRGTSLQGSVNGDFSKQTDEDGYRYTEHTAPATETAQQWQGWGTALKPAFEPIVVARKPLAGTVAANVLAHGTGALNIDACRIAHDEPAGRPSVGQGGARSGGIMSDTRPTERVRETTAASTAGRWPANVVLDEDQAATLDAQSGHLAGRGNTTPTKRRPDQNRTSYGSFSGGEGPVQNDSAGGGASRFFYVTGREGDTLDSCESVSTAGPSLNLPSPSVGSAPNGAATRERPEGPSTPPPWSAPSTPATASASRPSVGIATPQTPLTVSGSSLAWLPDAPSPSDSLASSVVSPESDTTRTTPSPSSSSGTADRTTSPDTSFSTGPGGQGLPIDSLGERFRYVAKAPKKERPVVDGVAHPTVKPLGLMRWLVRLVTPPGGLVLDPFAGSGTTLEAAALEGFTSMGIEREADYAALIQARINRLTAEPQQDETPDTEEDPA